MSVELDLWNWAAGGNVVLQISDAMEQSDLVVALWSPAYFERHRWTTIEWTALVALGERVVALRIEPVKPPAILASVNVRNLYELDGEQARQALLAAVNPPTPPAVAPAFPGPGTGPTTAVSSMGGPRLPGTLPAIWNVPPRSVSFSGRDDMLVALRKRLREGETAAVYALHGIGGVGKTALAVEYAHRFAGDYDWVWWVDAGQPDLIGEQLAALAVALAIVGVDVETPAAVEQLRRWCRPRPGWLVVIDNAESVEQVRPWILDGPGHVVITSRNYVWGSAAAPIEVSLLDRTESVALLRAQAGADRLSEPDADRLAEALGDLPLAVAQAAGVLAETGISADDYLRELAGNTSALMAAHSSAHDAVTVTAVVQISTRRLAGLNPEGLQLLNLCAMLAPAPVAFSLLSGAPDGALPAALAPATISPLALGAIAAQVGRLGLARVGKRSLVVHRLVQAIVRGELDDGTRKSVHSQAEALLVAAQPTDPDDPASWTAWTQFMPHLIAVEPEASLDGLRHLVCLAAWALLARGDARAVLPLTSDWYERWSQTYGADDLNTLDMATVLARAHADLGQYEHARSLDEDTLSRYRRIHGEDHPDTLGAASNLAADLHGLGCYVQARALDEDTLARRQRVLGEDDLDTMISANNLAAHCRQLGDYGAARALDEDTVARRRRLLGEEHPNTLRSVYGLALDLHGLGYYEQARQLDEDTWPRLRRVLGEDHPDTLKAAHSLAADWFQLGQHERARALDEDTLARRDRVLGEDHPDTLSSAVSLAEDLHGLGDHKQAHEVGAATLSRLRRALGPDHPDTLTAAHNVATYLRALGEHQPARALEEDTLTRRRRVLGEDHPDTLASLASLNGEGGSAPS